MEQVSTETMKKQVESIRKKSMTVEYRKMRRTAETIEDKASWLTKNMDITLMVSGSFIYFVLGIGVTLAVLWGLYHFGMTSDGIPGGWKTFLGSIVTVILGILGGKKVTIAQLHTPHGEITANLIAKANRPKVELDNDLNTIVATEPMESESKSETKTCPAPKLGG